MGARAGLRLYAASTRARECTSARSLHSLAGFEPLKRRFRSAPLQSPRLANYETSNPVFSYFSSFKNLISPVCHHLSMLRVIFVAWSCSRPSPRPRRNRIIYEGMWDRIIELRYTLRNLLRNFYVLFDWVHITIVLTIIVLNNRLYRLIFNYRFYRYLPTT